MTQRSKTTNYIANTTEDLSSDDAQSEQVDEDFMCRVFYHNREIEKIKNIQELDLFAEIRQTKTDIVVQAGAEELKARTKIHINDFAPKVPEEVISIKKLTSSKRRKQVKPTDGGEMNDQ